MDDLIDRAALCKLFEERFLYLKGASETPLSGGYVRIDREIQTGAIIAKEFLDHVIKAPAVDAVEVVRCKDCKSRFFNEDLEMNCCLVWGDGYDAVQDDGFCSYGERRTDGNL